MEEKLQILYKAVKEMRNLQQEYKDTKLFTLLNKLKTAEKYVDRLLLEINELEHGYKFSFKAFWQGSER